MVVVFKFILFKRKVRKMSNRSFENQCLKKQTKRNYFWF